MGFVMVILTKSLLCDVCCDDCGTGDSLVGTISREPGFISWWKLSCEPASSSLIALLLARIPELLISSLDIVLLLLRKEFRDPLNEVLEPRALMDARDPWIEVREPCVELVFFCSCCPRGVGRCKEGELPGNLCIPPGDPLREIRGVGDDGCSGELM
jgi:hypothetical protein